MILSVKVAYDMEIVKRKKLTKIYGRNANSEQPQIYSRYRVKNTFYLHHKIYGFKYKLKFKNID